MDTVSILDSLKDMSIQQYKTDVGFRTLVESVDENLYIIPKYQRKYRWSREQVVGLVESLIRGLPIPPIYTCRNEANQLEILDGQQRVMSLFFYYIGYYLNKRKNSSINFSELAVGEGCFRDALLQQSELEKLHISMRESNGKKVNVDYASLPLELKRRIDYTSITVIEIKIDNEKRKSEILRRIFANLNRGGSLLSEQEQRNGIYACPFYDMLQDVNRTNEKWRNIWGRQDAKERDMEVLLRLCALRRYASVKRSVMGFDFAIDGYKSSYVKLLDRFSDEAMSYGPKEISEYQDSLFEFFDLFQVNSKQSSKVALLESFYIVSEKLNVTTPITTEIYNQILDSDTYKSYGRQGTIKLKSMNERWKTVYEIWAGANR